MSERRSILVRLTQEEAQALGFAGDRCAEQMPVIDDPFEKALSAAQAKLHAALADSDLLGLDDLSWVEGWTIWELEEFVKDKPLSENLKHYLGHAWRVLALRGWDANDPGSASVGFIPIEREKPPPEAFEWARRVAADYERTQRDEAT